MSGSRRLAGGLVALGLGATLGIGPPADARAAPPDDRVLPPSQYTSEKARALATKHARALRDLNSEIYHCLPWLEVEKEGIGFYKPRHLTGDVRYLSLNVYIEQDPSREFSSLTTVERASAMFSRYAGPLLRRMTRSAGVRNDDTIDGFTVIVKWLKQVPRAVAERPVHETIAVFVPRLDAQEYVGGRTGARELAAQARVLGWDGERPLGPLGLAVFEDDFVATFRLKDYQPEPGVTCPP